MFLSRFFQFSQKAHMVQKLTISHIKALIMEILIPEEQICIIIKDRTASLKQIYHITSKYLLGILCQF